MVEGKFLKVALPGGFAKWAGCDGGGPDSRESTLKGGQEELLRGGQANGVSVCNQERDPQMFLKFDNLVVG